MLLVPGRDPSPLAALAPVLRGGPGLAHPEGPGLDHDPDLALARPLVRGADPALLGDPGLDLQPGGGAVVSDFTPSRMKYPSGSVQLPSVYGLHKYP
ncbi:uncharacterized [Tachysurus ichikawai]